MPRPFVAECVRAVSTVLPTAPTVAALVTAVLIVGAATPAAADPVDELHPVLDCVVPGRRGSYQAVFGYHGVKNGTTVPIGPRNRITPARLNGVQPTTFDPGTRRGAFATASVAGAETISWTLGHETVTANAGAETCGPKISLPAEGNGVGPVLVLIGSVALSLGALRLRQRRARARAGARQGG